MGVLQRFERRIEEMVNRPFARAFKAEVQPVEIASALQRECNDRAAIVARGRTMVPNAFTVALGSHDFDRLSTYSAALGSELSAMVSEHAAEQSYVFLGPVTVEFEHDEQLETGRFRVRSAAVAGATSTPSAPPSGPDDGWGQATEAAPPVPGGPTRRGPWLDLGDHAVQLRAAVTRIGRGTDCDVRLEDPGVSRHHAEVRLHGRDVVIVDAGSTNGVLIDEAKVTQARLVEGTRIVLGNTTLVFHEGDR